jgi:hypothetical protein
VVFKGERGDWASRSTPNSPQLGLLPTALNKRKRKTPPSRCCFCLYDNTSKSFVSSTLPEASKLTSICDQVDYLRKLFAAAGEDRTLQKARSSMSQPGAIESLLKVLRKKAPDETTLVFIVLERDILGGMVYITSFLLFFFFDSQYFIHLSRCATSYLGRLVSMSSLCKGRCR